MSRSEGNARGAIAFFDLDGTLVVGQTQRLLVQFLSRRRMVSRRFLAGVIAWFVLYKLGLVKASDSARARAAELVAGRNAAEIEGLVADFARAELAPRLYPPSVAALEGHKDLGDRIVILSAALQPVVEGLGAVLNVGACEGTRLEAEGETYTGRVSGAPLYGSEKARVALQYIAEWGVPAEACSAYADHESDQALLELVGYPVAVRPRPRLQEAARRNGWRVIQ